MERIVYMIACVVSGLLCLATGADWWSQPLTSSPVRDIPMLAGVVFLVWAVAILIVEMAKRGRTHDVNSVWRVDETNWPEGPDRV